MTRFSTLDEFLSLMDDHDELLEFRGAGTDWEIGGITELAMQNRPSPVLVFNDIPNYPSGYRVVSNAVTTPFQWSAAMGFEPTESKRDAILQYRELSSNQETISPETVDSSPILDNVDRGSDVDVTKFPTPIWNEYDGGPYIGTGDLVITRNANTGSINAGVYRIQVHGSDKVTVLMIHSKDGYRNLKSYFDQDEPCPMIASVGHPIDLFIVGTERMPPNQSELDYLGGLRGKPVEVIEGEVTGLPIPAHSEIVLEGHIYPDAEPVVEGPFGEFTGYVSGTNKVKPLQVERVYHRDDPIILGVPEVRPPGHMTSEIKNAARLWAELEESGIPGIDDVNSFPYPAGYLVAVSIDQEYAGHSTQVGHYLTASHVGAYHGRLKVVVDADVDVYDVQEVLWAMTTRCDPATDIYIVEDCTTSPLDPLLTKERKEAGDLTNNQAVIDATRPYLRRDEFPQVNEASDELINRLFEKWGDELETHIIGN